MPGQFDGYEILGDEPDVTERFEEWLNAQPNLTMLDIDNIEMVLYMRLRSLLTVEQLHGRAHILIQMAEEALHEPGALADEDGNPASPILVENFPGGAREVIEMLQGQVPDDLTELLGVAGEEE